MSIPPGHNWLLAPRTEPAANLAAFLHSANTGVIPVPIESMISQFADVEEHSWPFDCDALAVGLFARRPTIFLKAGTAWRRRRFTLAHEFGHVMMGWHVGEIACKPAAEDAFSVEPLRPATSPADFLAHRRVVEQEAEASRFAAYLLMPDSFLRPLFDASDMSSILEESQALEVSTAALLLRLREMLQPGFVFELIGTHDRSFFQSSGTIVKPTATRSGQLDSNELARSSVEFGTAVVGNQRVRWYRLAEFEDFEALGNEARNSSDILRDTIARYIDKEEERLAAFRSINGIAGGSLSKERAINPTQALAILRHKFASSAHEVITKDTLFDSYLRRKAEEWARKRGVT
jgi:IrrE N-terminal-like domain